MLFSLPYEVKRALLGGNFSALLQDAATGRPLRPQVPATPIPVSTRMTNKAQYDPTIYVLHLADPFFHNPTMSELRRILQHAKAYVADVTPSSKGITAPVRQVVTAGVPDTVAKMQLVVDIESVIKVHGRPTKHALTVSKYNNAIARGATTVPCKYIANNDQLKATIATIEFVTEWLNRLENDENWPAQSPQPLPHTVPAAGYTADAPNRRYAYATHEVSGNIVLFDAIARALDIGCLSWKVILKIWDERMISMAEHVASVLAGSYIVQGGLNSMAAGISVASGKEVPVSTYQLHEAGLVNSSHWLPTLNATKTRTTIMQESLDALPDYLQLKESIREKTQRGDELCADVDRAKTTKANQENEERDAFNTRVDVQGHLLEDLHAIDEQYEKLKRIRDALYSVPGIKTFVTTENPMLSWMEPSQTNESPTAYTAQTLEKIRNLPQSTEIAEEQSKLREKEEADAAQSVESAAEPVDAAAQSAVKSTAKPAVAADVDSDNSEESDRIIRINSTEFAGDQFNVSVQRADTGEELMSWEEFRDEGQRARDMLDKFLADNPHQPSYVLYHSD